MMRVIKCLVLSNFKIEDKGEETEILFTCNLDLIIVLCYRREIENFSRHHCISYFSMYVVTTQRNVVNLRAILRL